MKNILGIYKLFWKNIFNFRGCTDKRSYWIGVAVHFVLMGVILGPFFQSATQTGGSGSASSFPVTFLSIVISIPFLSATVRRLRDGGYSWYNLFWLYFPIIGWIAIIVKLCDETMEHCPPASPVAAQAVLKPSELKAEPYIQPASSYAFAALDEAMDELSIAKQMAEMSEPEPEHVPFKPSGTFYAFVAQGVAFGGGGSYTDVAIEKADEIKDEYSRGARMRVEMVWPGDWGGNMETSNNAGVALSSFNPEEFEEKMKGYLKNHGCSDAQIEEAFAAYKSEGLHVINPFSGTYVMGMPVFTEES